MKNITEPGSHALNSAPITDDHEAPSTGGASDNASVGLNIKRQSLIHLPLDIKSHIGSYLTLQDKVNFTVSNKTSYIEHYPQRQQEMEAEAAAMVERDMHQVHTHADAALLRNKVVKNLPVSYHADLHAAIDAQEFIAADIGHWQSVSPEGVNTRFDKIEMALPPKEQARAVELLGRQVWFACTRNKVDEPSSRAMLQRIQSYNGPTSTIVDAWRRLATEEAGDPQERRFSLPLPAALQAGTVAQTKTIEYIEDIAESMTTSPCEYARAGFEVNLNIQEYLRILRLQKLVVNGVDEKSARGMVGVFTASALFSADRAKDLKEAIQSGKISLKNVNLLLDQRIQAFEATQARYADQFERKRVARQQK